ncbi:hypothetical protein PF008_g4089 [Phytophthora fragariae]|uniref:Uncharacterized protein n=2 Tax=Phytophthora fragariae TaxID=53985 RepID=A0A6G0SCC9_9STRA|nr:hypothetical protein PF008_g4089 [Phytophthora fragariae]
MKSKEEPPGKEAPGPPPPAAIDLCQQTQIEEDCYMPEQIAGVKPRQEVEAETPESDDDDNQDNDGVKTETIQTETAPMHQVKDAADNNSKKARPLAWSIGLSFWPLRCGPWVRSPQRTKSLPEREATRTPEEARPSWLRRLGHPDTKGLKDVESSEDCIGGMVPQ